MSGGGNSTWRCGGCVCVCVWLGDIVVVVGWLGGECVYGMGSSVGVVMVVCGWASSCVMWWCV